MLDYLFYKGELIIIHGSKDKNPALRKNESSSVKSLDHLIFFVAADLTSFRKKNEKEKKIRNKKGFSEIARVERISFNDFV